MLGFIYSFIFGSNSNRVHVGNEDANEDIEDAVQGEDGVILEDEEDPYSENYVARGEGTILLAQDITPENEDLNNGETIPGDQALPVVQAEVLENRYLNNDDEIPANRAFPVAQALVSDGEPTYNDDEIPVGQDMFYYLNYGSSE